jgi:hypothetical protein
MTRLATVEIWSYDFDVPVDFFAMPLADADEVDSRRWAQGVLDDVMTNAENPGDPGELVDQLVELRTRLLGQNNPWLSAAVSIRPQQVLSIGALLVSQQLALDPDDGPDAFEDLVRAESERMRPGARSRDLEIWRDTIPSGEVVGALQRIEFTDLAEPTGRLTERTMFGVFPENSSDMIQFTFTSEDFGAFADIRSETQAIVATLRVETAAA